MKIILQKYIVLLFFLTICSVVFSQSRRRQAENFFGLQFRPLIPLSVVGDRPIQLNEGTLESTVSPIFGYSYGGVVRVGFTKLLALETGLNYTKRRYRVDYKVPDSNITATDKIGYVTLNLPVSFLVYIKLGQQFYMNVSGGVTGNFNVSNIRSQTNPEGMHLFIIEGKRFSFFDFEANANVGFEYRTEKIGTFYLGISARIPFKPTLYVATEYRYDTHKQVAFGLIKGATFALDIKYFFHNSRRKNPVQPLPDVIDQ